MSDPGSQLDMLDVYVCFDGVEAERLASILSERGIEPLIRDRLSTTFPTTVGHTGAQIVAVRRDAVAQARGVVKAAIEDEAISAEGHFL